MIRYKSKRPYEEYCAGEKNITEQNRRESNFMNVKQLAALVYYLVLFYFI